MQHVYSVFTSMVKVTMSKSMLSSCCFRISIKAQCNGWYWISKMHVNTSYRKYIESHMMQRYEEKTCKSMMMTLTLDIAFLLQAIGHGYVRGYWVFGDIYIWIYGCWKVNWIELGCWSSLFMMNFFIDDGHHCGLLLESVGSLDITALAYHVQMKSTSWWASTKDRALGKSFIYITTTCKGSTCITSTYRNANNSHHTIIGLWWCRWSCPLDCHSMNWPPFFPGTLTLMTAVGESLRCLPPVVALSWLM